MGREAELAAVDGALVRLAGGRGGACLISGEPGIGKSRLLEEAGRRAAGGGLSVFEGRATELERDFPFGAFIDALDPYLASLERTAMRALSEEQRRLLAFVFPAMAAGGKRAPCLPRSASAAIARWVSCLGCWLRVGHWY